MLTIKTIVIILFLSFGLNLMAQTPDYFGNEPNWKETSWLEDDVAGWSNIEHLYHVDGDTIIAGFEYSNIRSTDYIMGQFRQEGRAIYMNLDGIDTLFISYEGEVGDPVVGYNITGEDPIIQKIDSVLIGSEFRRVFYVDTINSGIQIIEGIAVRDNANCSGSMFRRTQILDNTLAYIGPGNTKNYFYSYSLDETVHLNYDEEFCENLLSTQDFKGDTPKIYPNPGNGLFYISTPKVLLINVYDIYGNKVFFGKTHNEPVDLTFLPIGMYFIHFEFNGTKMVQKLFIISE